jgi:hypothetical protein
LERFSVPIGIVGVGLVTMMVPILCLPSIVGEDLDLASMIWTALVYGGPRSGVLVWLVVDARKWFQGPKVNVEHLMGRELEAGEEKLDVRVKGGRSSVNRLGGRRLEGCGRVCPVCSGAIVFSHHHTG